VSRNTLIAIFATTIAMAGLVPAEARESTVYTVDQLRNAIYAAAPGDRIYVAPGLYNQRLWVSGVNGTADNMIEVVALDPANRPKFTCDSASCFTLSNSSYVLVDGIEAYGGGTPTQDSNNIEFTNSNHMILKNSYSHDIDHNGNSDGVKFAGSSNILMYGCTVKSWADGGSAVDQMYQTNSLMMRNTILYPELPLYAGANGTQPKGESYENGYYKNYFNDGSSRCIQFGGQGGAPHWEAWDMVAMGNVIDRGEAAVAYVSCTDSVFDYNTILNPEMYLMRILREGGDQQTSYNTFRHNLIQYGNLPYIQNVGSNTLPATFDYAENYWYKSTNPGASIPSLPGGETNPAGGVNPQLDANYRPLYAGARSYGAHAPEMEAAWAPYTDWFAWAWEKALEYEPDAAAGGGYSTAPTIDVELDGSGSYAGVGSRGAYAVGEYLWDLDGDGVFDDAAGASPVLTYDDLTGTGPGQLGLSPGTHTVELQIAVTNEYGVTTLDWGRSELLVLAELLNGDANVDGVVGIADLVVLADHYGQSGGWKQGDFNADNLVGIADLCALADHYGQVAGGTVPEPTCLALVLSTGLMLLRRR